MKHSRLIILFCLLTLMRPIRAAPLPPADPAIVASIAQKATANWSKQDNKDYQTILASVITGSQDVTPASRKRFWAVLDKLNATPAEISYFLRTLTVTSSYQEHLFQDALIAYKRHTTYRSAQRAEDEGFLLTQTSGPPARRQAQEAIRRKNIAVADKMIADIAVRKPVFLADTGETVVFSAQRIQDTQDGLAIIRKRLFLLLTRP